MRPERVIRNGRVEYDDWRIVEIHGDALPEGPIAVPLATWRARRESLLARRQPVGVWLEPGDDPEALAADLPSLAFIAVHFPKLADGRGYSTGALLRRLGFKGQLRAFGDIGRDHLLFLRRCGYNAFSLPPHRDPEAALAAFDEISAHYQGSVEDPLPHFRRRAAARG